MTNEISFPNFGIDFTINRAAFSIGGIDVYWYGIIIAFGMILAFIYGSREFKRCKLKQDDLLNMFLISVPVAIICARLYYVIFSFDQYRNNPIEIIDIRNGGIAVYGSLIGAGIVVVAYCVKKKINIGLILDILAVGFLIGQSIGRWGNFVNGEAFGTSTTLPWAMTIKSEGVTYAYMVHPTFLYESLWDAAGVIILLLLKKHKKFNGEIFCAYILWYGLGRFWIEGLRTDSLYIGTLRISQIVALISVFLGTTGIIAGIFMKKQGIKPHITSRISNENSEQAEPDKINADNN